MSTAGALPQADEAEQADQPLTAQDSFHILAPSTENGKGDDQDEYASQKRTESRALR